MAQRLVSIDLNPNVRFVKAGATPAGDRWYEFRSVYVIYDDATAPQFVALYIQMGAEALSGLTQPLTDVQGGLRVWVDYSDGQTATLIPDARLFETDTSTDPDTAYGIDTQNPDWYVIRSDGKAHNIGANAPTAATAVAANEKWALTKTPMRIRGRWYPGSSAIG